MGQHDLSYRSFFAHRRMIEDLLREIVGERWVEHIDFDSGERVDGGEGLRDIVAGGTRHHAG